MKTAQTLFTRVTVALSIVQAQILAEDSALCPKAMFGHHLAKTPALEEAARILAGVSDELMDLETHGAPKGGEA